MGYCPWDRKELDTTEHTHTYTFNVTQPFHSFVCRETYTDTHTHTLTYIHTHIAPLTKSLTFAYRLGMDLKEAEEIKKKWQEYTKELYKKYLNDPDNHEGVIMHLEPDTLEYEVKWALGRITPNKASGGDELSIELFQILKDDAVKVLHSICQQIWKTQQWPQDWKR